MPTKKSYQPDASQHVLVSQCLGCDGRGPGAPHDDEEDPWSAFVLAGVDVLGELTESESRALGRAGADELLRGAHLGKGALRRVEAYLRGFADVLEEERRPMLRPVGGAQ